MKTDIISSWEKNASEWIKVIQSNSISSREHTNRAILDTITDIKAKKFVDIGCGEGWLTREISKKGYECTGLDAIERLLIEARKQSKEDYYVFTFEEIIAGKPIPKAPFDVAVFNFCLYLKEGLQELLENTLKSISAGGYILIQTLHPFFLIQNNVTYKSQWLSDSWKGLPGNFQDGHRWYARTFEDWVSTMNSLTLVKFSIKEVISNEGKPVSLIIKIRKI